MSNFLLLKAKGLMAINFLFSSRNETWKINVNEESNQKSQWWINWYLEQGVETRMCLTNKAAPGKKSGMYLDCLNFAKA